jgi:hypothetical protein
MMPQKTTRRLGEAKLSSSSFCWNKMPGLSEPESSIGGTFLVVRIMLHSCACDDLNNHKGVLTQCLRSGKFNNYTHNNRNNNQYWNNVAIK